MNLIECDLNRFGRPLRLLRGNELTSKFNSRDIIFPVDSYFIDLVQFIQLFHGLLSMF